MRGIKKWLLLPLVLWGISSFNTFANTSNEQISPSKQNSPVKEVVNEKGVKKADPQTLGEHFDVFSKEFDNEMKRRNERLSGVEEYILLEKMPSWASSNETSNFYYLTENERDELKDYGLGLLKDTGRETVNKTWWMDELKDFGKGLVSYGISLRGEKAGKRNYSSSKLKEEDRLEERALEEETTKLQTTVNKLGENYEFDSGVRVRGIKPNLKDASEALEYYGSLKNFKILGNQFYKANFKIRGDEKTKIELTKLLKEGMYSRVRLDSEKITKGLDRITFSISKDDAILRSNWSVYVGYDMKNSETFTGFNYVYLF
jgi:hypothetical protein